MRHSRETAVGLQARVLAMDTTGKTRREIAAAVGYSPSYVSEIINCSKDPTLRQRKAAKRNQFDKANPLWVKYKCFCKVKRAGKLVTERPFLFTFEQLVAKIGPNPHCADCRRSIDLSVSSSYALDHIWPRVLDGLSTLENCQILCFHCNQTKNGFTPEERNEHDILRLNHDGKHKVILLAEEENYIRCRAPYYGYSIQKYYVRERDGEFTDGYDRCLLLAS